MSLIQCQNCKKEVPDNSQYCSYCGSKIIKENKSNTCPNCNRLIAGTSSGCSYCGYKLNNLKDENNRGGTNYAKYLVVTIVIVVLIIVFIGLVVKNPNSSDNVTSIETQKSESLKPSLSDPTLLLRKAEEFYKAGALFDARLVLGQIINNYKDPKDSTTVIKANEIIKKVDETIAGKEKIQELPIPESKNIIIAEEKGNQDVPKSDIHKFKSERMVMTVNELSVPFDIVSYHTIDFTNKKVVIQINEDYDKPNYTRFNIVSESTTKSGNSVIATLNLRLIGGDTKEQELINKLVFSTSLGTLFYSGNGSLVTYGQLSVVE